MTHLSIVIPVLNAPLLRRTLTALEAQCTSQDEIIVVGQAAPGSVYSSPRIRFLPTETPVPPATARNIGSRAASGKVLCFIDADCLPCPDWLERIRHWFQNPAVTVVGGGVDTTQRDVWALADHISSFHDYLVTAPAGTRLQLPTLNLAVRREAFEAVGGFDERFIRSEDADLTTRLRLAGHTLHFDPHLSVVHLPDRHTARAAWQHTWQSGFYSIKVHPKWRKALRAPIYFRHPLVLLLATPFLALGVTLQIFRSPALWRWWYLFPVVMGLKCSWCLGAFSGLRHHRRGSHV